ncbi:MAG: class I SAM-dependent methyltransferase [bacterium]
MRKKLFGAKKILHRIRINPGERILELGPGSGYLTVEASKRAGDSGRLCCLDIQLKMIEKVRQKVIEEGLSNVGLVVGDACQVPFKGSTFDSTFLVTVFGEIRHRGQALKELRRVVKSGGTLSVTELLPDPHYSLQRTTRSLCQKGGFVLEEAEGNFFQYTVNFRKA